MQCTVIWVYSGILQLFHQQKELKVYGEYYLRLIMSQQSSI